MTATQLPLRPRPKTALDAVGLVLRDHSHFNQWITAYEVQHLIQSWMNRRYSESCITARIRDLRKARHGGHRIDCRRRRGSSAYEYRMAR